MRSPTDSEILELVRLLVERFHPERVVLFGSRSRGAERPDSDVDLLVILDHKDSSYRAAVDMLLALRPKFPVEFVVRKPQDATARYEMGDPILREALDHGRTLYQRAA